MTKSGREGGSRANVGSMGRPAVVDMGGPRLLRSRQVRVDSAFFAVVALAVACVWCVSLSASLAAATVCPNAEYRSGPSERLPDCRAYEQVSPVEKSGYDAVPVGPTTFPAQAAVSGDSMAFMSMGAFAGATASEIPNAYVSTRGAKGWQPVSLGPETSIATPPGGTLLGYDFSPALTEAVIKVPLQPLTPDAPAGVYNLFLRQTDGSYSLLTTAPPSSSLPPDCGLCFHTTDVSAFAGASSGFTHVLFEANESLTPGAPGGGVKNLYESVAGQVRLVGVLPDGAIAKSGSTPGAGISQLYSSVNFRSSQDVAHAISQDGSHVVFQAAADTGGPDPQQNGLTELFERENSSVTTEVSAPVPGAKPANPTAEPSQFWAASADGSRILFTSSAELTTQSNTGSSNTGKDLYRYRLHGGLTDLTVDPVDANGAAVLGVVGASEDGSYIYFVATGQLGGKGVAGEPNLYLWHENAEGAATTAFIATLSGADSGDWTSSPGELQSYLTPDGRHLAFTSARELTGYDNRDQATGERDAEVYAYSAETGALACGSCDPSGARPTGPAFIGARSGEPISTPFHQPRSLSDDGTRLFFSSPDPLVAGAASRAVKVFEYSAGAVGLVSSGASGTDDLFLDASATGNDVFFATRDRLVQADQDNYVDVYDARVDGGLPAPLTVAPCAGGACQGSPSTTPELPSSISASFSGPGDLPPPAPPRRLTRAQLLSRALATCRRIRSRRARDICVRAARRRYAPRSTKSGQGGHAQRRRHRAR
jgi:WD40-like Beta Propeller Repeat